MPIPTGTSQVSYNEIGVIYGGASDFTRIKGSYDNWLPAIDFDITPVEDVVLRASYSHTITRASYAALDGGIAVASPIRPAGGSTAGSGNPGLLPYKSKNIDLSAEWYYGVDSYLSVGYFNKKIENFIGNDTTQVPFFGLTNPGQGAIFNEAVASVGAGAPFSDVLAYVVANYPGAVEYNAAGDPIGIIGQATDPQVIFTYSQPINSDQTATLSGWEFALQHSFWDTGFGAILNYTIVNNSTSYDNTLPFTATQFAVPGASDTANAVLYFEKFGFQARVAYNWREEHLSGYGLDPFYVEDYGQFDVSASYDFGNGLSVFAEGINITNEDRRGHRRADQAVFFAAPGYARYAGGVRFTW